MDNLPITDIANALEATTKVLVNHSKRLDIVEREIDDLFAITSRAVKAGSGKYSKRVVLGAFLLGAYIGYRNAEKDLLSRQALARDLADKQTANTRTKPEPGKDDQQS